MLFLQAAGSDFDRAHELVAAVTEAIRSSYDDETADVGIVRHHHRRRVFDPERIAQRVERAGCTTQESLLVALAAHLTIASPLSDVDHAWTTSAAARIGDADLLLETAGVVFAFNAINRIADARRVRLEYRFLRELKPVRGWVERRLASLTGVLYDLSYQHQPRHSSAELLDRLTLVFERLGASAVPDVFHWLSRSPVVLEGVVEMLEANVKHASVRFDLLKEAAAIAVASRAMPGSGLSKAADQWLARGALLDADTLRSCAAAAGAASGAGLEAACRQYSWQVANAAYTISEERIDEIGALGLFDAELLDLTLATALFSALTIIEPISTAVAPHQAEHRRLHQHTSAPQLAASPTTR